MTDENGVENDARITFDLKIEADEAADLALNDAGAQVVKATETAQTIYSWETPLGKALQSLEQIMNLVGGMAEAS